jgi:hypothetical protein
MEIPCEGSPLGVYVKSTITATVKPYNFWVAIEIAVNDEGFTTITHNEVAIPPLLLYN